MIHVSLAICEGCVPKKSANTKTLFYIYIYIYIYIYEIFLALCGFPPFYDPRIVKTANTKSANNEDRVYCNFIGGKTADNTAYVASTRMYNIESDTW